MKCITSNISFLLTAFTYFFTPFTHASESHLDKFFSCKNIASVFTWRAIISFCHFSKQLFNMLIKFTRAYFSEFRLNWTRNETETTSKHPQHFSSPRVFLQFFPPLLRGPSHAQFVVCKHFPRNDCCLSEITSQLLYIVNKINECIDAAVDKRLYIFAAWPVVLKLKAKFLSEHPVRSCGDVAAVSNSRK